MKKGKHIKIQLEQIGEYGVITTTTLAATVEYANGDNITVKGADGFIREVDRYTRNDDGAYLALF